MFLLFLHSLLKDNSDCIFEDRGMLFVKGKGEMNTWFLRGIGDKVLEYDNPEPTEKKAEGTKQDDKKDTAGMVTTWVREY